MMKRIAIFLDSIDYKEIDEGLKVVVLFDVNCYIVRAVGRQLVSVYNVNYLIVWLLGKGIKEVYMDEPDEQVRQKIERCGVSVYPLSKIKENPLLKSLEIE